MFRPVTERYEIKFFFFKSGVHRELYILKSDKINVIVVWNGYADKNVLNRLGIKIYPILNITYYEKDFNQNFIIQLETLQPKRIIKKIGTFNKQSRLLSLEELHGIMCSSDHKIISNLQNPRTHV